MKLDLSFLFASKVYRFLFILYITFILLHSCLIIYSFVTLPFLNKKTDSRLDAIEEYLTINRGMMLVDDPTDSSIYSSADYTIMDNDSLILVINEYKEQVDIQNRYIDKLKAKLIIQDSSIKKEQKKDN